jgi:hypothetical protein
MVAINEQCRKTQGEIAMNVKEVCDSVLIFHTIQQTKNHLADSPFKLRCRKRNRILNPKCDSLHLGLRGLIYVLRGHLAKLQCWS